MQTTCPSESFFFLYFVWRDCLHLNRYTCLVFVTHWHTHAYTHAYTHTHTHTRDLQHLFGSARLGSAQSQMWVQVAAIDTTLSRPGSDRQPASLHAGARLLQDASSATVLVMFAKVLFTCKISPERKLVWLFQAFVALPETRLVLKSFFIQQKKRS